MSNEKSISETSMNLLNLAGGAGGSSRVVISSPLVTMESGLDIDHYFIGEVWIGTKMSNLKDEELDEASWEALSQPIW